MTTARELNSVPLRTGAPARWALRMRQSRGHRPRGRASLPGFTPPRDQHAPQA
jgi:hypothetical protein